MESVCQGGDVTFLTQTIKRDTSSSSSSSGTVATGNITQILNLVRSPICTDGEHYTHLKFGTSLPNIIVLASTHSIHHYSRFQPLHTSSSSLSLPIIIVASVSTHPYIIITIIISATSCNTSNSAHSTPSPSLSSSSQPLHPCSTFSNSPSSSRPSSPCRPSITVWAPSLLSLSGLLLAA